MNTQKIQNQLLTQGFAVINNVFNTTEVDDIIEKIPIDETANPAFRSTADLFAIRQFLKEVPEIKPLIFIRNFNLLLSKFLVKIILK